jgi:multidrug efflux pump subunit AcrA (membrane-fusion protein)
MYVSAGQTLFTIVDPKALRIELDLPATETGTAVDVHDVVDLDLGSQGRMRGNIDFVQPFFSEGVEFIKIRVYVRNAGELRIGQLVRGNVVMDSVEALWIPREAVLDLGTGTIVFVKERGVFKPKTVKVGTRSGEWVAISQGLSSSDEFAANAQYLVDSESFIKSK